MRENLSRCLGPPKIEPVARVSARPAGLEWRHARLGERTAPRATRPPRRSRSSTTGSPSATGSSRRSRWSTGSPFALTRHLARLARSAAGPRAAGARRRRGTTRRRRRARRPATGRWAGCGSPTPAGRRRSAPGAATTPPTLVVVAAPLRPWPETTAVVTVPWPRNERGALAGLKTTSYAENVVALAYAAERGAHRGDLRQPAGPPVRGHRLQRLLRRRRRAAHADAGSGLPGRHHPRADPRVVRRRRGRRADRGRAQRASEVFLASTTRDVQAVHPLGRPRAGRSGPVTEAVRAEWRAREAADARPVTRLAM